MLDLLINWYELNTNAIVEPIDSKTYIVRTTENDYTVGVNELVKNILAMFAAIENDRGTKCNV